MRKREWLGVYQDPGGELLHASRSPHAIRRKLKQLTVRWPIFFHLADSKKELSTELQPMTDKELQSRDRFLWLRRRAYEAIAEARKRINHRWGFYSEADLRTAKDFLRDLGNEARNSGKPKGDRPQAQENRKMLRAFYLASQGKGPKEIAIEMNGSENYERKMRSLSVQMKRFSQRVGKTYCSRYGRVPESILQTDAPKRCWGPLSGLFGSIEEWPGVKSNCLEDGYALCEALRRYKPANAEQKPPVIGRFQQL